MRDSHRAHSARYGCRPYGPRRPTFDPKPLLIQRVRGVAPRWPNRLLNVKKERQFGGYGTSQIFSGNFPVVQSLLQLTPRAGIIAVEGGRR